VKKKRTRFSKHITEVERHKPSLSDNFPSGSRHFYLPDDGFLVMREQNRPLKLCDFVYHGRATLSLRVSGCKIDQVEEFPENVFRYS